MKTLWGSWRGTQIVEVWKWKVLIQFADDAVSVCSIDAIDIRVLRGTLQCLLRNIFFLIFFFFFFGLKRTIIKQLSQNG